MKSNMMMKLLPRLLFALAVMALLIVNWSCTPASTTVRQPGVVTGEPLAEPDIRACLLENLGRSSLAFQGEYRLKLEEAVYRFNDRSGVLSVFRRGEELVLQNDQRFFELPVDISIVFTPVDNNSRFILNDFSYSGQLSFIGEERRIVAVNKLPLETYLRGVVPNEIPTRQEDYREAALAQAIAARSYAIHRIKTPVSSSYDIRADVRDQVYRGHEKSTPLSVNAVIKTRGMVLTSRGEPIPAYYHSTCGGLLENQVDSLAILAYRARPAIYDITGDDYNCKLSPYYRWVESRSAEMILRNLAREFDVDSLRLEGWLNEGFQLNIEIISRKNSSRVKTVMCRVAGQTFQVDGYKIRRVFADDRGLMLPSDLFLIHDGDDDPGTFLIIGAGFGHGRGMCQWGAIGMSLKGKSHKEILDFYYPDYAIAHYYQK